jgi:hypothetical protein
MVNGGKLNCIIYVIKLKTTLTLLSSLFSTTALQFFKIISKLIDCPRIEFSKAFKSSAANANIIIIIYITHSF